MTCVDALSLPPHAGTAVATSLVMITQRNLLATAGSMFLFVCANPAFAEEAPTTVVTEPAPAPAPPPVQSVTVQQPPAQVATTTTTAAPYAPVGSDRHTERTIEHRPNGDLLKLGTGLFIVSYGSSIIGGVVSDRDSDKRLFIPVVGPWMDLADRNCGARACGNSEDIAKAMIVTSGVVQGAGLLLAIGSLIIPDSTTVTEHSTTAKAPKPAVKVTPLSFAAGAGVGAIGTF